MELVPPRRPGAAGDAGAVGHAAAFGVQVAAGQVDGAGDRAGEQARRPRLPGSAALVGVSPACVTGTEIGRAKPALPFAAPAGKAGTRAGISSSGWPGPGSGRRS